METKRFQRKKENFTCGHCGTSVKGDGYTNHCPKCLWSKHVDINPGDRAATCGGLMEPMGFELKSKGEEVILHRCQKCGFSRKNRVAAADDRDEVIRLSAREK